MKVSATATPGLRPMALALLLVMAALLSACSGYATRLQGVRVAVYDGNYEGALETIDGFVARGQEGRRAQRSDLPLLLLERGSLYQALGQHDRAVVDFAEADSMLEVLEMTPDGVGAFADYLFNDSHALYQAPVYEKLMVNVTALASWLAMGDLSGARVEARRIEVMADYFAQREGDDNHPALGIAWYMAGLASEAADDRAAALRFYLDAWALSDAPGLAESLVRLAQNTPFETNADVLRARESLGLQPDAEVPAAPQSELITIVLSGLPPIRQPVRLPVGAVIAAIRADATYAMTPEQEAQLARAMAEDVLTFVNYPELVLHNNPLNRIQVAVDGRSEQLAFAADIEALAVAEWERQRTGIALAAILRALVRIGTREAIQGVGNAVDNGNGVAQTVGFLASLITQGAMTAADEPDTRTWSFMPAYLWIDRRPVEPGEHTVTIRGTGDGPPREQTLTVQVPESGVAFAVVRFLE